MPAIRTSLPDNRHHVDVQHILEITLIYLRGPAAAEVEALHRRREGNGRHRGDFPETGNRPLSEGPPFFLTASRYVFFSPVLSYWVRLYSGSRLAISLSPFSRPE